MTDGTNQPTGPDGQAVARFRSAWLTSGEPIDDLQLLPSRLATAAVRVLAVDGAGRALITGTFRIPLGASDDTARRAEQLQFTLGHGPCLDASRTGTPTWSATADIEIRWPLYAEQLFEHTPYRAVMSVPLHDQGHHFGAVDLYIAELGRLPHIDVSEVTAVAHEIATTLTTLGAPHLNSHTGIAEPVWLDSDPARTRQTVWVAAGILTAALQVANSDAIALLQAHAYARDTTIDDIAHRLARNELAPHDLHPDGRA